MKTTIKKPIIPEVRKYYYGLGEIKHKKMKADSPIKAMGVSYSFSTDPTYLSNPFNPVGVLFEAGYNVEGEESSMFFLSPKDATDLGNSLIEAANKCADYNTVLYNRDKMVNILRKNIERGYVDTLVVKYHKRFSSEINDKYTHIYNIYPIYKKGIVNNHFNFNIPLCITNFTTVNGNNVDPRTLTILMRNTIDAMFRNNIPHYSCLSKEDNDKIAESTKFKIKFVNIRKIVKQDYEYSRLDNMKIKTEYKEKQKKLLNNAQYAAERDSRLSKTLKNVPRDKNGKIDFEAAIKTMGIKMDFNGKK